MLSIRAVLTGAATVVVALVCSASLVRAAPALRAQGGHFRDAAGGVVLLRGVNVAGNSKMPPFRPVTDPAVFDPLRDWGMNVVRLLFTWEAYEAQPGVYDESYLDYYEAAVDAAASRGLYVVVDFHQDAFSRFSIGGCGSGFPRWAIPWWVIPATPKNDGSCWDWGARMIFDIPMHLTWAAFHGDATGARSRYLQMIARVATRLVGHRGVIAYEFMNEPWGNEETDLYRLYEDAARVLRGIDPDIMLFVLPHALIGAGGRSKLRRPTFGNFAYAPHYYDAAVLTLHHWFGGSLDGPFGNMLGVADDWGVPAFIGEFGAPAQTTNGTAYIRALYDELDEAFASGAQWAYTPGWTANGYDGWNHENLSIVDDLGRPRANFVARPYPRRIAGTPIHMHVDADGAIEVEWLHDPVTGVTEIYAPGKALAVTTLEGDAVCAVAGNLVRCHSASAKAQRVRVVAMTR